MYVYDGEVQCILWEGGVCVMEGCTFMGSRCPRLRNRIPLRMLMYVSTYIHT